MLGGLALGIAPLTATVAQQDYPQTLYWGSGLIDIPVAWVSPISGDFALQLFREALSSRSGHHEDQLQRPDELAVHVVCRRARSARGRCCLLLQQSGVWFFVRGVLVSEEDLNLRGGALKWFPALAVGMRNLGKYSHIDRFGIGYALLPPTPQDPDAKHEPDSLHLGFDTAPTLYVVATKSMVLNQFHGMGLSVTLGGGNGLFSDDGGLGGSYAKNATGGFFYGAMAEFPVTPDFRVNVMLENNAWDFNLGASAVLPWIARRVLCHGAGGRVERELVQLSFAGALLQLPEDCLHAWLAEQPAGLVRGDFLQKRADRLAHEREQLLVDIDDRQRRVAALQSELDRYEAQNLLELEQRRAAVETQLRQEKETLRRLEDRLKRLEQQRGIQPPPKP
jgi:hypothetical protein